MDRERILRKIRKTEREILFAQPKKAAALAEKIVKLKEIVFR